MGATTRSFISLSKIMTHDGIEAFTLAPMPFYECNIHCYTHGLYYGDGTIMDAYLPPGGVASFRSGNLADLFLKNLTAGNNGKLVIVATIPNKFVSEAL